MAVKYVNRILSSVRKSNIKRFGHLVLSSAKALQLPEWQVDYPFNRFFNASISSRYCAAVIKSSSLAASFIFRSVSLIIRSI